MMAAELEGTVATRGALGSVTAAGWSGYCRVLWNVEKALGLCHASKLQGRLLEMERSVSILDRVKLVTRKETPS